MYVCKLDVLLRHYDICYFFHGYSALFVQIGDFGILVRSGFTVSKALFFNFLSALVALAGTALVSCDDFSLFSVFCADIAY